MSTLQSLGRQGEKMAIDFLLSKGYSICETNYRTRGGEIDIIAEKNNVQIFIEVKTRTGDEKGKPYEAVTYRKVIHLQRAISFYLKEKNKKTGALRIDVISIELNPDQSIKKLQHFQNIDIPRY